MQNREASNKQLQTWITKSGCLIHPSIKIPSYYNNIQGIGTTESLPHKTVIIAIPSKLVITVQRCYQDPQLKSLYKSNDDLFDYEADEDAQFNILCVFLMFQKIHIQSSIWAPYLNTIAEPQTGVAWPDRDLAGLNKSVIQEILHVRLECRKVQEKLCGFLLKTKQFKHLPYNQILKLFRICYPTVLTRCFGYYFSTACMIPIADLMNHGCQTIDHQLIHVDLESQPVHLTYQKKHQKLDCSILNLTAPEKRSLGFRLDYLLKNNLIPSDVQILQKMGRNEINCKIYEFLEMRMKNGEELENLDFCDEDDQEDNDTDDEQEYGEIKNLQNIRDQEKKQMQEFRDCVLQVQTMRDVESIIKNKYAGNQAFQEQSSSTQDQKNEEEPLIQNSSKQTQQPQKKSQKEAYQQKPQKPESNPQSPTPTQQQNPPQQTPNPKIFPIQNLCPIQMGESSQQESSCSEEEEWCLDEKCYFTMSTYGPVSAGSQLFNSYGSRTNRFLLVWYGFTYPNNLYDSVTFRLQAHFPALRPKPEDIVLDTYVGGQGLCFKKNQQQQVKPEQVSKQFRLKRSRLPLQFLIFLRLMLIHYYTGPDNYKLLCTIPSSLQFELELLKYFHQIIKVLYLRYPLQIINQLKQCEQEEEDPGRRSRIRFKIIYLEEQRKILDCNCEAVLAAIGVVSKLRELGEWRKQAYEGLGIQTIRKVKEYLLQIKNNFSYILYDQNAKTSH